MAALQNIQRALLRHVDPAFSLEDKAATATALPQQGMPGPQQLQQQSSFLRKIIKRK